MSWIIAAVLVALWVLGMMSGYTMGLFVHLLLAFAIVVTLMRFLRASGIA